MPVPRTDINQQDGILIESIDPVNAEEKAKDFSDSHTSNHGLLSEDDLWELAKRIVDYCEQQQPWPRWSITKKLRNYQRPFAERVVFAIINNESKNFIQGFFSRQSGKSFTLSIVFAGLAVILPALANSGKFTDPKLIKFSDGFWVGIYAPTYEQVGAIYSNIKQNLYNEKTKEFVKNELNLKITKPVGRRIVLPNGSLCHFGSAGPTSNVESKTFHALVLDETQDIPTEKITKSLLPMLASTNGVTLMIGTPSRKRNFFYEKYLSNKAKDLEDSSSFSKKILPRKRRLFEVRGPEVALESENYRDYLESMKEQIGEDSEEYRMSYMCEWIGTAGTFTTPEEFDKCAVLRLHTEQKTLDDETPTYFRVAANILTDREKLEDPDYLAVGIDFGEVNCSTIVTVAKVWLCNDILEGNKVRHRVHIVDWLELLGDDYEIQKGKIHEFLAGFKNIYRISLDATGVGRALYPWFRDTYAKQNIKVIAVKFSSSSKQDGYFLLKREIVTQRLSFPYSLEARSKEKVKRFRTQVLTLEKDYDGKFVKYARPKNDKRAHDDYPDSLMILIYGVYQDAFGTLTTANVAPFGVPAQNRLDYEILPGSIEDYRRWKREQDNMPLGWDAYDE